MLPKANLRDAGRTPGNGLPFRSSATSFCRVTLLQAKAAPAAMRWPMRLINFLPRATSRATRRSGLSFSFYLPPSKLALLNEPSTTAAWPQVWLRSGPASMGDNTTLSGCREQFSNRTSDEAQRAMVPRPGLKLPLRKMFSQTRHLLRRRFCTPSRNPRAAGNRSNTAMPNPAPNRKTPAEDQDLQRCS